MGIELEIHIARSLENWLDSTAIWRDGQVYKIKKLVTQISDLRIIIHPHDHLPPHFHVESRQRNINARFNLETLDLMDDFSNQINSDDVKRIKTYFRLFRNHRQHLIDEYRHLNVEERSNGKSF